MFISSIKQECNTNAENTTRLPIKLHLHVYCTPISQKTTNSKCLNLVRSKTESLLQQLRDLVGFSWHDAARVRILVGRVVHGTVQLLVTHSYHLQTLLPNRVSKINTSPVGLATLHGCTHIRDL